VRSLRMAWLSGRDDAVAAALTFAATLLFAPQIQNGIFTGVLFSLGLFIYGRMRPTMTIIAPRHDAASSESIPPGLRESAGIVRFDASLVFVNVAYFERAVLRLVQEHPALRSLVLSFGAINDLDASGVEMLSSLVEGMRKKGVAVTFCGVKTHVRDVLERTGLAGTIGPANFFASETQALESLAGRQANGEPARMAAN